MSESKKYKEQHVVGDCKTAVVGEEGEAIAGENGTAVAGDQGHAVTDDGGRSMVGGKGKAFAGHGGTAWAGSVGCAIVGDRGIALFGENGRGSAGKGGILVAQYWENSRLRMLVRYVGENGVLPDVMYEVGKIGGQADLVAVGKEEHTAFRTHLEVVHCESSELYTWVVENQLTLAEAWKKSERGDWCVQILRSSTVEEERSVAQRIGYMCASEAVAMLAVKLNSAGRADLADLLVRMPVIVDRRTARETEDRIKLIWRKMTDDLNTSFDRTIGLTVLTTSSAAAGETLSTIYAWVRCHADSCSMTQALSNLARHVRLACPHPRLTKEGL